MVITSEMVAQKIIAHLNQQLSLAELVDWAEDAFASDDIDFDEKDTDQLGEILAALGAADIEGFKLTVDDCYNFLNRLGYRVSVSASKIVA